MATVRIAPTAAAWIEHIDDALQLEIHRPPEYAGDLLPVEVRADEWAGFDALNPLLSRRNGYMYQSRERDRRYERYRDGREVTTDTGLLEAVYAETWAGDRWTIAGVTGYRRRYHYQSVVETEDYQEWRDTATYDDAVLGFRLPAGPIRAATLQLSYHWYLDPGGIAAPHGEVAVWLDARLPPITEDGARMLLPAWERARETPPLWRRRHDRIPQTPPGPNDPPAEPQRRLTIPLPAARLSGAWAWLRLGVLMEEPLPPAANPPEPPGGEYVEFREAFLGLYCDLDRCALEVEIGEPEPRRTVVHVATRERARRRAPSATARLRT